MLCGLMTIITRCGQIVNMLTAEELLVLLPERLIVPRVFRLRRYNTLFISGLGRVDYISVGRPQPSHIYYYYMSLQLHCCCTLVG